MSFFKNRHWGCGGHFEVKKIFLFHILYACNECGLEKRESCS